MALTRSYGTKPPKREPPPPEAPDRVSTSVVAVGPKPTRIGVRSTRSQVTIHNPGVEAIFLGGKSVSPQESLPVQPGGYASLDLPAETILYAVSSTPEEVEIRVLEIE